MKLKLLFLLFFYHSIFTYSQGWAPLTTTGTITPRTNASAIYIPSQNKMFVFGGATSGGHVNELWSLDLSNNIWSAVLPKSGPVPPVRYTHTCMYDSLMNRMLLFSGQGSVLYNDVWAFNFADSTWQVLFADGNIAGAPLKRYGNATAFDPLNRDLINFAGFTTSGRFDDTWIFGVDAQSWTDESNTYFPLKRCLTSACYAGDRREMIVYGGQSTGNLDDLWALNLDTYTWLDYTPAIKPIARHYTSNVYCGNGHVVIFGGNSLNQGNNTGGLNDLWTFSMDNQQWDSLPQGSTKPLKRFGHTAIYIPLQDKMIIFGGQGASAMFADTWVYSGISALLNSVNEKKQESLFLNCFPNPSNGDINVHFTLSQASTVNLTITDISGRIIAKPVKEKLIAGEHIIKLNFFSSGIYLCSLQTDKFNETVRVVVIEN